MNILLKTTGIGCMESMRFPAPIRWRADLQHGCHNNTLCIYCSTAAIGERNMQCYTNSIAKRWMFISLFEQDKLSSVSKCGCFTFTHYFKPNSTSHRMRLLNERFSGKEFSHVLHFTMLYHDLHRYCRYNGLHKDKWA